MNSSVQPGVSTKSCMRAGRSRKSVRFVESKPSCELSFNCRDAVVKPVVEDPMVDDRIPVESGAEFTRVSPAVVRENET